jgi:hypothetical protein
VATGRSAGIGEESGTGSTATKGETSVLVEEAEDVEVAGVLGYGGSSSSPRAASVFAAGGAPMGGLHSPSPFSPLLLLLRRAGGAEGDNSPEAARVGSPGGRGQLLIAAGNAGARGRCGCAGGGCSRIAMAAMTGVSRFGTGVSQSGKERG